METHNLSPPVSSSSNCCTKQLPEVALQSLSGNTGDCTEINTTDGGQHQRAASKYLNTLGILNRLIGLSILLYHLLVLVAMRGQGIRGRSSSSSRNFLV
jgi:hypothetical protein